MDAHAYVYRYMVVRPVTKITPMVRNYWNSFFTRVPGLCVMGARIIWNCPGVASKLQGFMTLWQQMDTFDAS